MGDVDGSWCFRKGLLVATDLAERIEISNAIAVSTNISYLPEVVEVMLSSVDALATRKGRSIWDRGQ